jgi:type II secretion system protein C
MNLSQYDNVVQKGLLLVAILAFAGSVYLSATVFLSEQATIAESATPTANALGPEARSRNSNTHLNSIAQWNLFGTADKPKPATVKKAPVVNAPETRLDLKLLGVVFDKKTNNSFAIIKPGRNKQKLYKLKDVLPGNAEITEITERGVTLKRAGRFESLTLESHKSKKNSPVRRMHASNINQI